MLRRAVETGGSSGHEIAAREDAALQAVEVFADGTAEYRTPPQSRVEERRVLAELQRHGGRQSLAYKLSRGDERAQLDLYFDSLDRFVRERVQALQPVAIVRQQAPARRPQCRGARTRRPGGRRVRRSSRAGPDGDPSDSEPGDLARRSSHEDVDRHERRPR
jgi:hypothetical protein